MKPRKSRKWQSYILPAAYHICDIENSFGSFFAFYHVVALVPSFGLLCAAASHVHVSSEPVYQKSITVITWVPNKQIRTQSQQ